jgi:predicted nucleic acid-binding protein
MGAVVVVDASVWVSRLIPQDVNHDASRFWLERYVIEGGLLVAPALLLIEVAAAISRQTGQSTLSKEAVRYLQYVRAMRFVPLDSTVAETAVEIAADLQLRAGDATYVAVARLLSIPLVSWDREQIERSRSVTATYTPGSYTF